VTEDCIIYHFILFKGNLFRNLKMKFYVENKVFTTLILNNNIFYIKLINYIIFKSVTSVFKIPVNMLNYLFGPLTI